MEFDGQLLYHFDQVFSHTSQPKKKDCLKIHHKSKVKFSAFSEREISKITNTWSKWHSSRRVHIVGTLWRGHKSELDVLDWLEHGSSWWCCIVLSSDSLTLWPYWPGSFGVFWILNWPQRTEKVKTRVSNNTVAEALGTLIVVSYEDNLVSAFRSVRFLPLAHSWWIMMECFNIFLLLSRSFSCWSRLSTLKLVNVSDYGHRQLQQASWSVGTPFTGFRWLHGISGPTHAVRR